MKIGIIGYGSMGGALASRWAPHHDLLIGGRNRDKAGELAERLGAAAGTEADAAAHGDIVMLATRFSHVFQAIEAAGGAQAFAGKTVVDINNPVSTDTFLMQPMGGASLAQAIQGRLPEARVVKAFNTAQATVWTLADPVLGDRHFVVPICGDSAEAKRQVTVLIEDTGCMAHDFGGLEYAASIEHVALLTIKMLFDGADPTTVFNIVDGVRT